MSKCHNVKSLMKMKACRSSKDCPTRQMCIKSKCAKVAESAEKKNKNQNIKVLTVLEFLAQGEQKNTVCPACKVQFF